MEHNKYNLKEGDLCILDTGFNNSGEVRIISFTLSKLYTIIYSPEDETLQWEVMTNRLSPLK